MYVVYRSNEARNHGFNENIEEIAKCYKIFFSDKICECNVTLYTNEEVGNDLPVDSGQINISEKSLPQEEKSTCETPKHTFFFNLIRLNFNLTHFFGKSQVKFNLKTFRLNFSIYGVFSAFYKKLGATHLRNYIVNSSNNLILSFEIVEIVTTPAAGYQK